MTSRKFKPDKRLKSLQTENKKLYKDVEALEDGLLLHERYQDIEDNSVKGLLRKEIGGSRWEHGGSGKLTTYKDTRDLHDTYGIETTGKNNVKKNAKKEIKIEDKSNKRFEKQTSSRTFISNQDLLDVHVPDKIQKKVKSTNPKTNGSGYEDKQLNLTNNNRNRGQDLELAAQCNEDKLTLLKTKVLEKVSSGVISRKKNISKFGETFDKKGIYLVEEEKLKSKRDESKFESRGSETVSLSDKQRERGKFDRFSDTEMRQKNKEKNHETVVLTRKKFARENGESAKVKSVNKKDADIKRVNSGKVFKNDENDLNSRNISAKQSKTKDSDFDAEKKVLDVTVERLTQVTGKGTGRSSHHNVCNDEMLNAHSAKFNKQNKVFSEQHQELDERTRSSFSDEHKTGSEYAENWKDELHMSNLKNEEKHKSGFGGNWSYELVDKAELKNEMKVKPDSAENWKYELDYHPSENIFSLTNSASGSAPNCDPNVKLWLRHLGLLEEEKYFKIFAENEIDMNELVQLTFEQLQNMGVVAIGAVNKILRGIKELKLDLNKERLKENLSVQKDKDTEIKLKESENKSKNAATSKYGNEESSLVNHIDFDFSKKDSDQYLIPGHKFSFVEPNYRFTPHGDEVHDFDIKDRGDNHITVDEDNDIGSFYSGDENKSKSKLKPLESKSSKTDKGLKLSQSFSERSRTRLNSKSGSGEGSRSAKKQTDEKSVVSNQSNSMRSRSSTQGNQTKPDRSVKRDSSLTRQNSAKGKRDVSLTRQNSAKERREDSVKKEASLTRPSSAKTKTKDGRKVQSAKSKQKKNEKNVKQTLPKLPRKNSADVYHVQTQIGGVANKFENKQNQDSDSNMNEDLKMLEKKKRRDEMAARHLAREKKKEVEEPVEDPSTYSSTYVINDMESINRIQDGKKDQTIEGVADLNAVQKVSSYRPVPRPRSVRQSVAVPALALELRTDDSGKSVMSSTFKISTKDTETKKETVKDIETEIQILQNMALSGEQVDMDKVKDLQQRLEHIEKDMSDKKAAVSIATSKHSPVSTTTKSSVSMATKHMAEKLPSVSMTTKKNAGLNEQSQMTPENGSDSSSDDDTLADSPPARSRVENIGRYSMASMSMSKRQLLNEIRKEKKKHRQQIKHLYSELQTIKHPDLLKTTELDIADISFETANLIGQGAFSRVYKGTYQGSEVAVKQLKIPLSSHDRNYFAAEVNLLQDLRHPRVVLLIGVCTTERHPLMILEYMARGSLYHRLHDDTSEPLDHAEYYRVAHDIALGMNYLHQHKPAVLHLDLKSMNVLICSNDRAKIADFGFSKFRHDADMKASAAKSKPLHGAPTYMAPELLSSGEITSKADVYSFGIILWEMLTRQQPYEGLSVFQILEKVRTSKRPEIPSNCPAELRDFIVECWHASPARRPSFKDVLRKLENMAFPPEWQALFKEAGIPEEALEDVQSARNIISLVSSRIEKEAAKHLRENDLHSLDSPKFQSRDSPKVLNYSKFEDIKAETSVRTSPKGDNQMHKKLSNREFENSSVSSVRESPKMDKVQENPYSLNLKDSDVSENISQTLESKEIVTVRPSPTPRSSLNKSLVKMNTTGRQGVSKSCDNFIEELKSVQRDGLPRTVRTDRDRYREKPEKVLEIKEGLMNLKSVKMSKKGKDVIDTIRSPKEKLGQVESVAQTVNVKKTNTESVQNEPIETESNETQKNAESDEKNQILEKSSVKDDIQFSKDSLEIMNSSEKNENGESSQPVTLVVHIPKLRLSGLTESHGSYVNAEIEDVSDIDTDSLDDSFPTPRDSLEDFAFSDLPVLKHHNDTLQHSDNLENNLQHSNIANKSLQSSDESDSETPVQDNIEENDAYDENSSEITPQKTLSRSRQRYSASKTKTGLFKDMHSKLSQNYGLMESSSIPKQSETKKSLSLSRNSIEAWVDDAQFQNMQNTGAKALAGDKDISDIDETRNVQISGAKVSPKIPLAPPPPPIGQIPIPPPPPVIVSQPKENKSLSIKPYRAATKVKSRSVAEAPAPKKTELKVTPSVGKTSFAVKSMELKDQKDALQSISKPHPNQLHDLSQVSKGTMHSIAEILKKAVSSRRIALGEDLGSPPQSVTSSWSCIDD